MSVGFPALAKLRIDYFSKEKTMKIVYQKSLKSQGTWLNPCFLTLTRLHKTITWISVFTETEYWVATQPTLALFECIFVSMPFPSLCLGVSLLGCIWGSIHIWLWYTLLGTKETCAPQDHWQLQHIRMKLFPSTSIAYYAIFLWCSKFWCQPRRVLWDLWQQRHGEHYAFNW